MASELASNSSEPKTGRPPKRRSFASLLPIILPVAAVVVALDRWSKGLAESELTKAPGQSVDVVDSLLRFSLIHNTGAAFNVLRDSSVLYVVIAAVVVIVSVGYYRYLPRDNYLLTVCLGMQLGGAIGNLIDRFQHVYVVDFIDVGFGDVRWPSFNVADSSIVVGIIVLAGYLMLHPDTERNG